MMCYVTFLVMWHHRHQSWYQLMLTVFSMKQMYFLGQVNENEVQHWYNCIPWIKATDMRCNISYLVLWCHWCWNSVTWCQWQHQGTTAFLRSRQLKWGATSLFWPLTQLSFVLVSHDTNTVVSGTTAFLRTRQLNQGATLWSCHMVLASTLCDANSIINGISAFLRSKWSKWGQHDFFWSWNLIM